MAGLCRRLRTSGQEVVPASATAPTEAPKERAMSLFAHHSGAAHAAVSSSEFALVRARYVAMPAVLWAAAMAAVLLFTIAQGVADRLAAQEPEAQPCLPVECTPVGA